MEARSVNQVRIYKLILNHIADRAESATIVAISGNYDRLVSWYMEQKAPTPYRDDGGWYRTFADESPLHWFNPADSLELNCPNHWGHGITDEWVNEDVWHNVLASGRFTVIEEE